MRKRSMSCCISPTTRKPFWVRYTVYLFLNSGAPVESSHWVKNQLRCCPEACSATLRRSLTDADLPVYGERKVRTVLSNASSPMTQHNLFMLMPPLTVSSDRKPGENGSSLPTSASGNET